MLSDSDRGVRLAAAHVIAVFPYDARSSAALESALAREQDPAARPLLGLALACTGRRIDDAFAARSRRLGELARMVLAKSVTIDDALDVLLDGATDAFAPARLDRLGVPPSPSLG